tara:strand:+ start:3486 stop:5549 length:2064 start_codon:yes stop_codon:yes gene_type:complete
MRKPINRTTVQTSNDTYRIYPRSAPLFYKKSDGSYNDIDLTFKDNKSTIGEISLMDKGVVSVGKRKGNNPHKVVGIRPDHNQETGDQQLEFSLINVELDNEPQEFNVDTDLEILLKPGSVMQLVKMNRSFNSFKIEFDIYSKNLELLNGKYKGKNTLCDYGFNLNNLGQDKGSNIIKNYFDYEDLNKNIPYMDCIVGQINDDYISTGEYSIEDEFGDSDLSKYVLEKMYMNGSSAYLKDCLVLYCKSYNIEDIESIFVSNMCNKFELKTIWEDNKNGQYFTKNDKKVASYYTMENQFFMFINTKEIDQDIKDLFKRKTFESTSFLDISLDEFVSYVNDTFNKDLKIEVDSNYYEPIKGSFKFKMSKESLRIKPPIAFDEIGNPLPYTLHHTLKDNEDGSYRYTKVILTEGALNHNNAKFIDVNLSPSTDDVSNQHYKFPTAGSNSLVKKTSSNFTTLRNATSSNSNRGWLWTGFTPVPNASVWVGDVNVKSTTTTNGNVITTRQYNYYHSHWNFDTSSISADVTSANFRMMAFYNDDSGDGSQKVILLKGTWDGEQNGLIGIGSADTDWNDFTGHTSGWDSDDVTEFSSEFAVDGTTGSSGTEEKIPINATGITEIEDEDDFKLTIIDKEQYYDNSLDTSYGTSDSESRLLYFYAHTHTTESNRPYLEVTVPVATPSEDSLFFGCNF